MFAFSISNNHFAIIRDKTQKLISMSFLFGFFFLSVNFRFKERKKYFYLLKIHICFILESNMQNIFVCEHFLHVSFTDFPFFQQYQLTFKWKENILILYSSKVITKLNHNYHLLTERYWIHCVQIPSLNFPWNPFWHATIINESRHYKK